MVITEKLSKTILSDSKIHDYVVNPYVGCENGCEYCYARFIKKFTGHHEPWGKFVDVKVNAADLLAEEVNKKRKGTVWVSGLCDPYQPLEAKYRLTRRCLEILVDNGWPVVIQTRSPLVLRDLDIILGAGDLEAGFSVTTADDDIRKIFEPHAPSIKERVGALAEMHALGVRTYAMIAPLLPGAEGLVEILAGHVDSIIVDRMNYHYADRLFREHGMEDMLTDDFFRNAGKKIREDCIKSSIACNMVY